MMHPTTQGTTCCQSVSSQTMDRRKLHGTARRSASEPNDMARRTRFPRKYLQGIGRESDDLPMLLSLEHASIGVTYMRRPGELCPGTACGSCIGGVEND